MNKSATCNKCNNSCKCPACDREPGIPINKFALHQIWNWTKNDIEDLADSFTVSSDNGGGGCGPSGGYTIFMVCLMDIWGGIFDNNFGGENTQKNITSFLKLLRDRSEYSRDNYLYNNSELTELCKILRHNLVHSYGLKFIHNQNIEYWLNIDVNSKKPVINKQGNGRWHVDCFKLKDDIYTLISDWINSQNIYK